MTPVIILGGIFSGFFTPSEAAVAEAREILAAMEAAKARGEGATVYKGRLVDIASIKQAEVIVKQAELIASSSSSSSPSNCGMLPKRDVAFAPTLRADTRFL